MNINNQCKGNFGYEKHIRTHNAFIQGYRSCFSQKKRFEARGEILTKLTRLYNSSLRIKFSVVLLITVASFDDLKYSRHWAFFY